MESEGIFIIQIKLALNVVLLSCRTQFNIINAVKKKKKKKKKKTFFKMSSSFKKVKVYAFFSTTAT